MTYTYLRVGTKPFRSKPPRKGAPCSEPFLVGSNIIRDPGFEQQLANYGGGPVGDEIPGKVVYGTSGPEVRAPWWGPHYDMSTPLPAPRESAWVADRDENFASPPDSRWWVETAAPNTGTYHARTDYGAVASSTTGSYGGDIGLYPVNFWWCDPAKLALGNDRAWVSRVREGDFIRAWCWAKASTITGGPTMNIWFSIWDSAWGSDFYHLKGSTALTTSYAYYEFTAFVPPEEPGIVSEYLQVHYRIGSTTYGSIPTGILIDIDDCGVEIS